MMLNPAKIEEIEQRKREKQDAKRAELENEDNIINKARERFDKKERSIHRDIPPAKDRVDEYKRKKCFGRLYNGLAAARLSKAEERPESTTLSAYKGELTTQAQSVFEEEEGATYSLPFKQFYTDNSQAVVYKTMNRFEGRSNYFHYYPTDDMAEQEIEKMWFLSQNKQVADKRREEELKQTLKDWSDARARVEMEV